MDHILRECRVSGQDTVWRLAKEIWSETGLEWPYVTVETVLGVGLLSVKDANGKVLKGRTRLLQILISECAHLIWCLRCEWRIGREGDLSKLHTEQEIKNRLRAAVSKRLRIDWALANKQAYGRKALNARVVAATWYKSSIRKRVHTQRLSRTGGFSG
ncbi:hypothetical protein DFP72DRAFT_829313 [Ephemerocybe angulata]|uniref:Uncharacterized protein n=1 Tax=Ephemerocybe angulata TaxID=980116 RepID=A0A8H6LT57_9AGAR|nr:hypothetical protein DFP72DRAFT_829313 [Tulosesus angulatus]